MKFENKLITVWVVGVVGVAAFWSAMIYVILHFVSKYW